MGAQCTAVYFADALSRVRPLTAEETTKLEAAIRRSTIATRRLWLAADDRELRRMLRKRMEATAIAEKMGRTPWAVRSRIRTLRASGVLPKAAKVRRVNADPVPASTFDMPPPHPHPQPLPPAQPQAPRVGDTLIGRGGMGGKRQSYGQRAGTAAIKVRAKIKRDRKERENG